MLACDVVETDSGLKTVDAMLRAARSNQKTSNPHLRITNVSLRTISAPLNWETTRVDLPAAGALAGSISGNVFDVIKRRRSIGQMLPALPPRAQIERLLESATYAPSHHVTEPWHFFVITGRAREQLGAVMEESLRRQLSDPFSEKNLGKLSRERGKPLRAPVLIVVALPDMLRQKGDILENIEAASAAVQNMLLTAEEMGLATIWRTGEATADPLIKKWLGLHPQDHIVAFLYVGYPKMERSLRVPTHFSAKTTWLS